MKSKQSNVDDTVNITATVEEIKKEVARLFSNVDLIESDIHFDLLGDTRLEC